MIISKLSRNNKLKSQQQNIFTETNKIFLKLPTIHLWLENILKVLGAKRPNLKTGWTKAKLVWTAAVYCRVAAALCPDILQRCLLSWHNL